MQQQDLLSLFQRPPASQQPDISQPGSERDGPKPQAPAEPQGGGSKDIESLFRNLAPNPPAASSSIVNSPPESTISLSSATSGNTDRQAALLSLLGTVGAPTSTPPAAPQQTGPLNQTSPSASQTQQGKFLLEQLVSGPETSNQAQAQAAASSSQQSQPPQFQPQVQAKPSVSSMPVSHSQPPPATHGQPMNISAFSSGHMSDREAAAETQRKALFDYVSPYDAFPAPPSQLPSVQPGNTTVSSQASAPPATTAIVSPPKKKPVPVYNPSPAGSAPVSPRITSQQSFQRGHTPSPEPPHYNMYQHPSVDISEREAYSDSQYNVPQRQGSVNNESPEDTRSNNSQPIGIQHGPLPPIPNNGRASPQSYQQRSLQQSQVQVQEPLASPPTRPAHPNPNQSHRQSPPPTQRQHEFTQQQAQVPRGRGSPASLRQGGQQTSRDGAGSPSGNSNGSGANGKRAKLPNPPTYGPQQVPPAQQQQEQRGGASPSQHSLISIDVTAPLVSTLAAPDAVSITPIALLKLEPTYTPGTTIGVANFIAYSMSRGRIRLIGRQTGERALLKLPATFPSNAQVQDMVISGTKLACVSNDGGLVVWDIPGDIEDDAAAVSRIILHVPPQPNAPGFRVVKWHPKQVGMLAVASEKEIYLLNIDEAFQAFGSEGVGQDELGRVSKVFSIPSPLVSFTFDVPQIALASISIDSTITLWSIKDKMPFWSGRVHGEGYPSSIDFLDGGLVVGRNQGNVIQLLPVMSTNVLSTIKFVFGSGGSAPSGNNGPKAAVESQELMFGHLCYDSASKILWVANSARNSLFAVKMGADENPVASVQTQTTEPTSPTMRPAFDQIVEFPCSMPTINLTVVPAEALEEGGSNWTRDPSLAVSAFCVHAGGVDQINIAQDAYDESSAKTMSKLPNITYGAIAIGPDRRGSSQSQNSVGLQAQQQQQVQPPPSQQMQQPRPEPYHTQPGSYSTLSQQQIPLNMPVYGNQQDIGGSYEQIPITNTAPSAAQAQVSSKKSKDISNAPGGKQQASWKASPSGSAAESVGPKAETRDNDALAAGLTKEIRKVEENLSTRIGRLISKELDKQQKNLEDVRHADQTADFERQEKILKLISTELTKNTTRVVESAVKNVIQNSVLPALETVTRQEVKVALNTQISKGLSDSMKQTLPLEIEKLLLRPDVSNNVARTFSSAITPLIERNVKEMINKSLVPAYTEATSAMQQEIVQEVIGQVGQIKKDIAAWQNESLKGTHNLIRDMDQTIRSLTEQVRTLAMQVQANSARSATPRTETTAVEYPQQHHRQAPVTTAPSTSSFLPSYSQPQQGSWGNPTMNTQPVQSPLGPLLPPPTMASAAPPTQAPAPAPAPHRAEPTPHRNEDWDSTFLNTLGQNDHKQIRDLLSRTPPDSVLPVGQVSPLSQTVILALIHRLALSLTELSPADDAFKTTLWWLQRCAYSLNPNDNVIAPYIGRVLQTAQNTLNTTVQRLNVLPGGPSPAETSSMVGQIQQTLSSLMT